MNDLIPRLVAGVVLAVAAWVVGGLLFAFGFAVFTLLHYLVTGESP